MNMKNMKNMKTLITISMAACLYMLFTSSINPERERPMTPSTHYYCEYCGHKFPSVRQLTSATCPRHPDGSNKGHHKLYEGSEKSEYTCKYCGKKFPSIQVMVGGLCVNHPKGSNKGGHAPAL